MSAASRVATALRILAAAALVVLASGAVVRTIAATFDPFRPYPGHTSDYGVARTRAMRAALPEIVDRRGRGVIVLGSSGLARAFVPSVFDAAVGDDAHYVSFNFAQLLLQPETALAMARVIRDTYEAQDKRLGLAIVGVSVPELTRDALRAARRQMPDQAFAFSTTAGLLEQGRTDPGGAARDALTLLLFGNVRPERVELWAEDWMRGRPGPCESGLKQPVEGAEAYAALVAFCTELQRRFPGGVPPWNPSTRGGFDFGLPATRPMLERLVALQPSSVYTPPPPPAPVRWSPDEIDDGAVRTLIAAVREIRAVSERAIVLPEPMNPAVLATLPEAQVRHWHRVAERIARESDATLVDLDDGGFVPSDFGDRTHLHPLAAERFSARLAVRLKSIVQESRASR